MECSPTGFRVTLCIPNSFHRKHAVYGCPSKMEAGSARTTHTQIGSLREQLRYAPCQVCYANVAAGAVGD